MVKILSPVASFASAVKVISAGADEIYCGVRIPRIEYLGLSTRADRCSLRTYDELGRIVKHSHDHGVKIIVTSELPFMSKAIEEKMRKHIRSCVEEDIDALIASDIGIILMMKDISPDMPRYASTYLASMNYEAVDFLRKLGIKRVILERHLTINEIREIVKRSKDVEIEVFVHGSGCSNINVNCYGCPGGVFKVPRTHAGFKPPQVEVPFCRTPFEIYEIDGDRRKRITNAPILDAYSFCSICRLPDLVKTGVTGFKIVGRCLDEEYQEKATRTYCELVDLIERGQMETFQRKLKSIGSGVDSSFKKIHVPSACEKKRCYYSPLFHAPYKVSSSPCIRGG